MTTTLTMLDKIWNAHVIVQREGEALLYVDRNFVHEGSFHAFAALAKEGRKVRKPHQTFGTANHYVPTVGRDRGLAGVTDPEIRGMVELFEQNTRANDVLHLGIDDPRQGIVHVVGPELGLTQPGLTISCGGGDSHAPRAQRATRSNTPGPRFGRCRWKAGSPSATCRSKRAHAPAWSRLTIRPMSTCTAASSPRAVRTGRRRSGGGGRCRATTARASTAR